MTAPRLQGELKKRAPFDSPQQAAALNLLRTADQLQIRFSRLFRAYGLTSSQYNILRILRGEGRPLPILEIAQRTITVVPGITGLVDRLEQAGLVRRERCPEDRRVIFVALSEQAQRTLAQIDAPLAELHRDLLRSVSRNDLKLLDSLLEKIRSGLPPLDVD